MKLRNHPVLWAAIGVVVTIVLAAGVVLALQRTGDAKAGSDNAPLIAAVIALGGVFTAQMVSIFLQQQRTREARTLEDRRTKEARNLEAQRAGEAALQNYFENVGELLIEQPLRQASPGDNLSTVVRAQTLSVLEGLDPDRKRILLLFLYESELIHKELTFLHESHLIERRHSIVSLIQANLSEANLSFAFLSYANLIEAVLSKAELSYANLGVADLIWADLTEANLSGADLSGADLSGADLSRADLREVKLSGADLSGANLTGGRSENTGSTSLRSWARGSGGSRRRPGLPRLRPKSFASKSMNSKPN